MEAAVAGLITADMMSLLQIGLVFMVTLYIKSLLDAFVQGALFKWGDVFNEGDHVFIDGEKAIIVSVGLKRTVLEVENGRGKCWMYVENTELKKRKFEKVITPKEIMMNKRRRSSDKQNPEEYR